MLPATALDFLSVTPWFSLESGREDTFSGVSGRRAEPDGTSPARSGGWSFPTEGLACR